MYPAWRKREGKKGTVLYCHLCSSQRLQDRVATTTLGYLGSIALEPTRAEREVFWMQVKGNLDKQNLSKEQRAKIEAALANKVKRGKNPHGDSDAPVE